MERVTDIDVAYSIVGENLIGLNELRANKVLSSFFSFIDDDRSDIVPFSKDELIKYSKSHILILVSPYYIDGDLISLKHFRNFFGFNPEISEPCFYNQDWYLNEDFFINSKLSFSWMLISKSISTQTRGKIPDLISISENHVLSALQYAYVFFIYFLVRGKPIWENDYIWTSDFDSNNDQVYVGRYKDPKNINKNGFSIHRHLSIKSNYGIINVKL